MAKFGIVLLVVGAGLGVFTYLEGNLAFRSSAEPEEITLKQLIARGPDGNGHILLTDFVPCDNFVHEFEEKNKDRWTSVWIPVIPAEDANPADKGPPKASNVQALIFSIQIHNLEDIRSRLGKPKVQALVTNRIKSLDSKSRSLLQKEYPGTDFDKCLIIQEGRTPFSRSIVYLMGGGALVAFLADGGLLLGAWRRRSQFA
jgi:hypothetical protein